MLFVIRKNPFFWFAAFLSSTASVTDGMVVVVVVVVCCMQPSQNKIASAMIDLELPRRGMENLRLSLYIFIIYICNMADSEQDRECIQQLDGFPHVKVDSERTTGFEPGPLGWHTSAQTTELTLSTVKLIKIIILYPVLLSFNPAIHFFLLNCNFLK